MGEVALRGIKKLILLVSVLIVKVLIAATESNYYKAFSKYTQMACSKKNINQVLQKLEGNYEKQLGFLLEKDFVGTLPEYFFFIFKCIPLELLEKQTKDLSYGFRRQLLLLKYKYIVESHLANCIDPVDYTFGHYKGQHQRIWKLPNKKWIYLILKRIITQPNYAFMITGVNLAMFRALRIVAVDALSETTYNKRKVIRFLKKLVDIRRYENSLNDEDLYDLSQYSLISLGILGEKDFVNEFISQLSNLQLVYLFRGWHHIYYFLEHQKIDLYIYSGQYVQALRLFRTFIQMGITNAVDLYNLACLYALMGNKKKALSTLKRAIKAGYRDLKWLKKDKELDIIKRTKGYKKLIKQLERKLKE